LTLKKDGLSNGTGIDFFSSDLIISSILLMALWHSITLFLCRFKHPFSLPQDLGEALGVPFSNFSQVSYILSQLTSRSFHPLTITKWMPRKEAESIFIKALKQERFGDVTRIGYLFNEGWLEFVLYFDTADRLRRVVIQHQLLSLDAPCELQLTGKPKS
jgi:hypothetical protein